MPRAAWWSSGGGADLMSEVTLYGGGLATLGSSANFWSSAGLFSSLCTKSQFPNVNIQSKSQLPYVDFQYSPPNCQRPEVSINVKFQMSTSSRKVNFQISTSSRKVNFQKSTSKCHLHKSASTSKRQLSEDNIQMSTFRKKSASNCQPPL